MRLWAEDALADGEKLPQPRSIETMRADPEVAAVVDFGVALGLLIVMMLYFGVAPGVGLLLMPVIHRVLHRFHWELSQHEASAAKRRSE